ncbi:Growth factor receptor-bound protein 10 [Acromyrmex echinatior]|uniref:Growth factor receptor-bound protein 10 n=1 Tax=Acromyrmex echinatior TaxID=103372 RepID=F4WJR2_ACREC|nr:Growth factor receptor-bound protein 10 [Acromyrmex echinatior]
MCSCIDGSSTLPSNRAASYERLGSNLTIFELNSTMRRSRRSDQDLIDSERQEELRFYNNDHSFTTVVVEKNLRTIDLCELLKVKRNTIGAAWSIIETWPKLGIERTLEDHEDILAVHRELEMFASQYERRFYFSQDFLKYEVFIKPVQFFPPDMITFPSGEERGTFTEAESALRNYLLREDSECPYVFSMVWMRNASSNGWKKMYMLLQGRKLYTTKKVSPFVSQEPRIVFSGYFYFVFNSSCAVLNAYICIDRPLAEAVRFSIYFTASNMNHKL